MDMQILPFEFLHHTGSNDILLKPDGVHPQNDIFTKLCININKMLSEAGPELNSNGRVSLDTSPSIDRSLARLLTEEIGKQYVLRSTNNHSYKKETGEELEQKGYTGGRSNNTYEDENKQNDIGVKSQIKLDNMDRGVVLSESDPEGDSLNLSNGKPFHKFDYEDVERELLTGDKLLFSISDIIGLNFKGEQNNKVKVSEDAKQPNVSDPIQETISHLSGPRFSGQHLSGLSRQIETVPDQSAFRFVSVTETENQIGTADEDLQPDASRPIRVKDQHLAELSPQAKTAKSSPAFTIDSMETPVSDGGSISKDDLTKEDKIPIHRKNTDINNVGQLNENQLKNESTEINTNREFDGKIQDVNINNKYKPSSIMNFKTSDSGAENANHMNFSNSDVSSIKSETSLNNQKAANKSAPDDVVSNKPTDAPSYIETRDSKFPSELNDRTSKKEDIAQHRTTSSFLNVDTENKIKQSGFENQYEGDIRKPEEMLFLKGNFKTSHENVNMPINEKSISDAAKSNEFSFADDQANLSKQNLLISKPADSQAPGISNVSEKTDKIIIQNSTAANIHMNDLGSDKEPKAFQENEQITAREKNIDNKSMRSAERQMIFHEGLKNDGQTPSRPLFELSSSYETDTNVDEKDTVLSKHTGKEFSGREFENRNNDKEKEFPGYRSIKEMSEIADKLKLTNFIFRSNAKENPATTSGSEIGSETGKTESMEANPQKIDTLHTSIHNKANDIKTLNALQEKGSDTVQSSTEKSVVDQIVKKAVLELNQNKSEIRVNIKPDSLGSIKIQVLTEYQQTVAKISAETIVVKEIIEQHIHQLKSELQQNGIHVEEIDVTVEQDAKDRPAQYRQENELKKMRRLVKENEADSKDHNGTEKSTFQDPPKSSSIVDYYA